MKPKINVQLTESQVEQVIQSMGAYIKAKNMQIDELMDSFGNATRTDIRMDYAVKSVEVKCDIAKSKEIVSILESALQQNKTEAVKDNGENSAFGFGEAYIFVL